MQQKVLIIEDSKTSMKVMQALINEAKLKPVCACSLIEAKHIFSSSAPEEFLCAVVDYNLPDAQHGEAIDFTIESFLPTIVVTGLMDEGTRTSILKKNVVDYITKENTQIYEYLSRLLRRLEKNKKVGVLVVDDSRVGRNTMVSLLRRHNFITYEATDGQQGLDALRRHNNIKLAIIDENMPVMSGLEMLSELRRTRKKEELAVIGVSADNSSGLSARFIKSGANDYLHKPYCHEEFFCRIMQNVEHVENIEAIRRAANSDYLTGLPNRRHFFNRVSASQRLQPANECLAIIDIAHFKLVNDKYGHDCGDYTLKQIAKLLALRFGGYNAARFGGEEFCVHLPHLPIAEAYEMLEGFRQELANKTIVFEGEKIICTVSVGLTAISSGGINSMIRAADAYLYKAKENGRNQVVWDIN
jgi:diguanylate cyclase (GGDEF)-like protein